MDIQAIRQDEYYEGHDDPELDNKVWDIKLYGFGKKRDENEQEKSVEYDA